MVVRPVDQAPKIGPLECVRRLCRTDIRPAKIKFGIRQNRRLQEQVHEHVVWRRQANVVRDRWVKCGVPWLGFYYSRFRVEADANGVQLQDDRYNLAGYTDVHAGSTKSWIRAHHRARIDITVSGRERLEVPNRQQAGRRCPRLDNLSARCAIPVSDRFSESEL